MNEATPNPDADYGKFSVFINGETDEARHQMEQWLTDRNITTVGCVDKLTSKGAVNPPGGGMFLFNEGVLPQFLDNRRGQSGTLFVHDYCGYMRVVMGLDTLTKQKQALQQFKNNLTRLQKQYGTKFSVVQENNGSAKPYMK